MARNIDDIFRRSSPPEPPARLLGSVMEAVARERRRGMLLRRLPLLGAGLALSGAASAYAVALTVDAAARTGLAGFLTVIVTDTGAVAASWQDYLLSLLDALPVAPLAAVCGGLFVFFTLLRSVDRVIAPPSRLHVI